VDTTRGELALTLTLQAESGTRWWRYSAEASWLRSIGQLIGSSLCRLTWASRPSLSYRPGRRLVLSRAPEAVELKKGYRKGTLPGSRATP